MKTKKVFLPLSIAMMFGFALSGCNTLSSHSNSDSNLTVDGNIEVISIGLDKTSRQLNVGKSIKLNAIINPDNATNKTVIWSSSDNSVASVNQNGLVTASSVGEAIITASIQNSSLKATCNIIVVADDVIINNDLDEDKAESIEINQEDDTIFNDFSIINNETNQKITPVDGVYTISDNINAVYIVSGKLSNGYIKISASDSAKIELDLDNASISSNKNSPIYIESADKVEIKSKKGSKNFIYDKRATLDESSEDSTQGKAAIYSKADLKFTGTGITFVSSSYNNGIHTTKDMEYKNASFKIEAISTGIKANVLFIWKTVLLISNVDGMELRLLLPI